MISFLKSFFSVSFWFGAAPDISSVAGRILLGLLALCVVSGVVVRVVASRSSYDRHAMRALRRVGRLLSTCGIVGLVLAFLSYENVRFLGDRFWYAALVLGALLWACAIAWQALRVAPKAREAERLRREKEKYLP
ncbi:hypothetical protein EPO34_02575 [Patescibacteria group bacterium]|nr:MAG: hypothetical protein EPO34_02575 [Patescibacteria group bacterium]